MLFLRKAFKDIFAKIKKIASRVSVNDRVIASFCKCFISRNSASAKVRENLASAKISEFTCTVIAKRATGEVY